eukprot:15336641-Ditylum_brightwellii.AAC.1
MMMPRQGHLHAMRRVFGYLKQNYKFSIDYNIKEPDFSMHKIEEYDWFPLYGNTNEEELYGVPEPKGKPVVTNVHPSVGIPRDKTVCRQVREAVASKIVSVVYCDTKCNLADMGTKSLCGAVHQFLIQNQNFPPVLTAGVCKTDMEKQSGAAISGTAKYMHTVLSPLDME